MMPALSKLALAAMLAARLAVTAPQDHTQPIEALPVAGKLEFEVASVRQNKTDDEPTSTFSLDSGNVYSTVKGDDAFIPSGDYFSATNQPLWRYVVFAYKLSGTQELALRFNFFAGLTSTVPGWVNTTRFDIRARVDGKPTKDQVRLMMQALLKDRFKLVAHTETREVPVLAMVLAKPGITGARLQAHASADTCAGPAASLGLQGGLPEVCGVIAHLAGSLPGRVMFGGRNVPLSVVASSLPTQTGMATLPRPVVDETGLKGGYDFNLEWVPEYRGAPGDAAALDESGLTFLHALRDQWGIKLESRKGPVDLIVIDHLELPSAN